MPTAIGTPVTGQGSSSTPTLSVTVPSGCELMTVRVLIRGSEATPSATQGGNAMTVSTDGTTAADQQHSSTLHTTVFQYANPAPGTVNVVVTLSAARNYVMRVDFYDDFNAAAGPAGNGVLGVVKGGSSSVNPTALGTFASASGALELSAIGARNTAVSLSTTDATEQFELTQSTLIGAGAARTGTGATGQINWTLNTADNWALVNVSYAHASATTFPQTITATATGTASLSKRAGKLTSATGTGSATIARSISKPLSASAAAAATLARRAAKVISASSAGTATLAATRVVLQALTASAAGAAAMLRRVGKSLVATSGETASITRAQTKTLAVGAAGSAALVKRADRELTAGGTGTATVVSARFYTQTLAAFSSAAASLARRAGLTLTATSSATPTFLRLIQKTLPATSTAIATLSPVGSSSYTPPVLAIGRHSA